MQGHDKIGPRRYRESFGRYYDDFTVGDVYEHRPGRTITESDNTWFTLITMNTHPLHFDKEYAAKSEFKRPLVNSCLTLSMVVGMSVSDISQKDRCSLATPSTPNRKCWRSANRRQGRGKALSPCVRLARGGTARSS